MQTIFVAGTWGSGTTATAGALSALGVSTMAPLYRLNDPRTPLSYELVPFRELIRKHVEELSLSYKSGDLAELTKDLRELRRQIEGGAFGTWVDPDRPRLLLKLPLALACLPQVEEVFEPDVILVQRHLAEVETSRVRRRWPEVYGAKGASLLLTRALNDLVQMQKSFLCISYRELVTAPEVALARVIDFCGLQDLAERQEAAVRFIRR